MSWIYDISSISIYCFLLFSPTYRNDIWFFYCILKHSLLFFLKFWFCACNYFIWFPRVKINKFVHSLWIIFKSFLVRWWLVTDGFKTKCNIDIHINEICYSILISSSSLHEKTNNKGIGYERERNDSDFFFVLIDMSVCVCVCEWSHTLVQIIKPHLNLASHFFWRNHKIEGEGKSRTKSNRIKLKG